MVLGFYRHVWDNDYDIYDCDLTTLLIYHKIYLLMVLISQMTRFGHFENSVVSV